MFKLQKIVKRFFIAIWFVVFAQQLQAGLFSKKQSDFLPVDQAFQFSAVKVGDKVQLNWQIAEGYYLYHHTLAVKEGKTQKDLSLEVQSKSSPYQDPYFGEVEIYKDQLVALVSPTENEIEVFYQGCTDGLCYPPQNQLLDITTLPQTESTNGTTNAAKVTTSTTASNLVSEQDRLAATLFESKYSVFIFFLLGLGLAFTPCVLPMLPLLSAIVIGSNQRHNSWRAFTLSMVYVQGMAITYTLLGLIVAAIGLPFQVALQSPAVLITLAVIFTLLACSMFGLFTLQLPTSLQTKLTLLSQQQKGGAYRGVFVMGMIAGLVASPCTSAPLSGALLYVAQSGDLFTGAITLYLLALGMGIPLVLITLFGNKILPKSGDWLNHVKVGFGFVMLALPVFLLSRVLPHSYEAKLWSLLAVAFIAWLMLGVFKTKLWLQLLLLCGAIISAKPLLSWESTSHNVETTVAFQTIENLQQLEAAVQETQSPLVMLDLYADWCVACKEFDQYTFSDPQVQQQFKQMKLLRVDMTKNSTENQQIMEAFQVIGLPTIIFFDQNGKEISGSRVTGYLEAKAFHQHLLKLMENKR